MDYRADFYREDACLPLWELTLKYMGISFGCVRGGFAAKAAAGQKAADAADMGEASVHIVGAPENPQSADFQPANRRFAGRAESLCAMPGKNTGAGKTAPAAALPPQA